MKKILLLTAAFVFAIAGFSQKEGDWKEMHNFHGVMSKTFHPAEENDLKPVKENAADLLSKAKVWQSSTVPKGYKADVAKPILKRLVSKCDDITKAVKAKKSDADLKKMITEAHDIFHEIMEKCKEGGRSTNYRKHL